MRLHPSTEPVRVRGTPPTLRLLAPSLLAFALAAGPVAAQEPASATAAPVTDDAAVDASAAPVVTAPVPVPETVAPPAGDEPPATGPTPASEAADASAREPAAASGPPPTATSTDADATQAELDYDALYGTPPSAGADTDPTAPPANASPGAYDPWEPYNRRMHRFNDAVDRRVARPLARAYVTVVPGPLRTGVSNFFSNLGQPVSAVNALLQGKPKQAAQALGRFVINTTLGIGGVFDPASDAKLPHRSEDFGQTLGVWGWRRSRYVELPLFGPRTLRDVLGMVGDAPLSPLRQVDADRVRVPVQGLQLVDIRAQLLATDSLREGAADDYALLRDAWSQRRHYQIFGDRASEGDSELPDYLLDEDLPTVPVDAMPVMPPGG